MRSHPSFRSYWQSRVARGDVIFFNGLGMTHFSCSCKHCLPMLIQSTPINSACHKQNKAKQKSKHWTKHENRRGTCWEGRLPKIHYFIQYTWMKSSRNRKLSGMSHYYSLDLLFCLYSHFCLFLFFIISFLLRNLGLL